MPKVSLGACSPVVGKPHGSRPACDEAAGANPCSARACDGSRDVASCVAYVGSEVACRDQSCSDGVESFSATCSNGICGPSADALTSRLCFPFVCGTDSCLNGCSSDSDCADGNVCEGGTCVSGNTCEDDVTVREATGGTQSCIPFRCVAGACQGFCASTDQCAPGFVCDTGQGQGVCVPAQGTGEVPEDEGGCGCAVPGQSVPGSRGLAALALAVLVVLRRRRKHGRSVASA